MSQGGVSAVELTPSDLALLIHGTSCFITAIRDRAMAHGRGWFYWATSVGEIWTLSEVVLP